VSQPIDPAERPADAGRAATPPAAAEDLHWMGEALAAARLAEGADEVPIGAVIVLDGECIGRGWNRTRAAADPTGHAEMHAIREAAQHVGAQRIVGATVYTTVEPCFMCAGALLHARVARVVWGVRDPKFGACASLGHVLSDDRLNHQITISEGVRADEARSLLVEFFQSKRRASAKGKTESSGG
jgi:tRNA(adenine34) deaminase